MRVEDLRGLDLFAGLSDEQFAELAAGDSEVRIEPGAELFREGDPADFWWVLVEGAIDLVRQLGGEPSVVGRMDAPGRWAGGFRAWDEQGVYLATGRGAVPGRVLRVPADVLRARVDSWFPFGSHLIRGVYGTARSIEATARQRESLAALGTLAAGLAHEINNPAAAATRAVGDVTETFQTVLAAVTRLASGGLTGPTADRFAELDALRAEIRPPAAPLSPLAAADLEDDLSAWLADHGVEDEWAIAAPLAAAGVGVAWCDRAAGVLGDGPVLQAGLQWVAGTLATTSILAELGEATRRISGLVTAITSYSQMDRGSLQLVDLTDGLDSTVAVLGHRLGTGVTVVRDYAPDMPRVQVHAGELNQVWTNLIDNAIDAMNGTGTLTLTTRAEPGAVLVDVTDTGHGMSPEVAARAFEAFFTTRDVGRGTGLGLDIARRIVTERHGGTITIAARRPGHTTLHVRLPTSRVEARHS
ncbi:ATP-binding protein [Parafrankia colletiae]|uniref:histidine kinase n=2 Tax=Parafrankia colletiae TaxID=573497 RepID=A0A1S1QJC0_9ACTN|nr:ATP-binding protein [Parafrankia colletiae]